jgi:hypothetical protein
LPPLIPLLLFLAFLLVIKESGTSHLVRGVVREERIEEGAGKVIEALEIACDGVVHSPHK